MRIFAISDLHLSLSAPYHPDTEEAELYKPMDVFGARWSDYFSRLDKSWRNLVCSEDVVLIAGDISWAMTLDQTQYDFAYLASLPGRKIMIKGNHDYWWSSISRIRAAAPPGLFFLQHSALAVGGLAVCGTRSWLSPSHVDFRENKDRPIYERELLRLRMALEEASSLALPMLVMLHYPPLLDEADESPVASLLESYPVQVCLYGHIHGDQQSAFAGVRKGIRYMNTSMDRLDFNPLQVAEYEEATSVLRWI